MASMITGLNAKPAPNVIVRATTDSTTLTMGDRTMVHLEILKPSHKGALADIPRREEDYHGMELVDYTTDSTELGNGRIQLKYDFRFQAFEPKLITLPGFAYVVDGDTTRSDIITFKVLPVELSPELGNPEIVDSLRIHPSETIVSIKAKWYDYIPDYWYWFPIAIAIVALIVIIAILYKKNGKTLIIKKKIVPPYELAIARLETLRSKRLSEQGHDKEYYTELTEILRQYLEGRFGINALEMSSTQILKEIRSHNEASMSADQMKSVLEIADFVKFAKVRPLPDDNVKAFNAARQFVEDTRPQQPAEDDKQISGKKENGLITHKSEK